METEQETQKEVQIDIVNKPKGRHSKRMDLNNRQTGKPSKYAYTIKDKVFGEFHVLNTANGWWGEKEKVLRLIDSYKIDANDDEACVYAGILRINLQYFQEIHPEFLYIKSACRQVLGLKAKKALAEKVEQNPEWYLERKRKDEYSPRIENTGPNGRDLFQEVTDKLNKTISDVKKHITNENASELNAGQERSGDEAGITENDGSGTGTAN